MPVSNHLLRLPLVLLLLACCACATDTARISLPSSLTDKNESQYGEMSKAEALTVFRAAWEDYNCNFWSRTKRCKQMELIVDESGAKWGYKADANCAKTNERGNVACVGNLDDGSQAEFAWKKIESVTVGLQGLTSWKSLRLHKEETDDHIGSGSVAQLGVRKENMALVRAAIERLRKREADRKIAPVQTTATPQPSIITKACARLLRCVPDAVYLDATDCERQIGVDADASLLDCLSRALTCEQVSGCINSSKPK